MENPTTEVARLMKQIPAEHHATVDTIIGITFQAAQHDLEQRFAQNVVAQANQRKAVQ